MFSYKLSENTQLRLLEERHAQELTDLTDRNREHLRAWLPWVDTNRTVEEGKNFIKGALKQFAKNKGFERVGTTLGAERFKGSVSDEQRSLRAADRRRTWGNVKVEKPLHNL